MRIEEAHEKAHEELLANPLNFDFFIYNGKKECSG
jgi:hypothetical protein